MYSLHTHPNPAGANGWLVLASILQDESLAIKSQGVKNATLGDLSQYLLQNNVVLKTVLMLPQQPNITRGLRDMFYSDVESELTRYHDDNLEEHEAIRFLCQGADARFYGIEYQLARENKLLFDANAQSPELLSFSDIELVGHRSFAMWAKSARITNAWLLTEMPSGKAMIF